MVKKNSTYFDTIEALQQGSKEAFETLKQLTYQYPYFQNAWLHLAKWASIHEPEQTQDWMQQTATRTFDRSILHSWNDSPLEIKTKKESKSTQKTSLAKPAAIKAPKTKKKSPSQEQTTKPIKKVSLTKKNPQITSFSTPEMSFTSWLQFVQTKEYETKAPTDRFALIDAFLSQQPKIKPLDKKAKKQEDLSESSWTTTDELMTETLAKIFVKQKKYDKAIQAYEILRLKYPEKNSFFANQINDLKNKQQ